MAVAIGTEGTLAAGPTDPDIVAVFDIQPRDVSSFGRNEIAKFSDFLNSAVTAAGLRTVPRSEIATRLRELVKGSYDECFQEACQIELGKALAAQKALSSTWTRIGETCLFSIRLYDLRTAVAEFSAKADHRCTEDGLRDAVEEVVQALRLRNEQGYGKFQLDLKEGQDIKNPPSDERGYLSISAVARGRPAERVEVYLNGERVGLITNGLFTKELSVGQYVVILRTLGDLFAHQRFYVRISPEGVRIPKTGSVVLEPIFGALIIEGHPSTATAVISGEPRILNGRFEEQRRTGSYTVVVEAAGYLPQTQVVTVPPGGHANVRYDLARNAGALDLAGTPPGAKVVIDHSSTGVLPLRLREVDVGEHVVEILSPGYRTERRIVSIRRGETVSLSVSLRAKVGRLKVEAAATILGQKTPAEAEVILDGQLVGVTPWKGEVVAEVGHELVLRLGSAHHRAGQVRVSEGSEQKIEVEIPKAWAGATSSLSFDLDTAPWEARANGRPLDIGSENALPPGSVLVELLLDGRKVGERRLALSPNEVRRLSVADRPLTASELRNAESASSLRRLIALSAVVAAVSIGGIQLFRSTERQAVRDDALSELKLATQADEVDRLRELVAVNEASRANVELSGTAAFTVAAGFAVWLALEQFVFQPTGPGSEAVEIHTSQ
ncbi:MAG: PEGA domain-containing protein [Deltaproteobacteria bacterium]|nr:PEGA domain-containing protein [Deltaproteobacteria bacterium]